jgi:hypothetical protein
MFGTVAMATVRAIRSLEMMIVLGIFSFPPPLGSSWVKSVFNHYSLKNSPITTYALAIRVTLRRQQ